MKRYCPLLAGIIYISTFFCTIGLYGQDTATDSARFYNEVMTYVNPLLPGDHPDPTLPKVGDDFYHCGSGFHFTPYLPIYHSKDPVHWEVTSRVVSPYKGTFVTDRLSAGIWQGAITYFHGSYWIYFSANGQHFCKADSPYGPWSDAVDVKTNAITGNHGYDNSIFVADDGKPYMAIKNGQKINQIQPLGKDGQLTDALINLDWINAQLQYSWAEGPVMCKRNGFYYYFPAGDVSGGQYVLRLKELTSDSTKWERLRSFFKPVADSKIGYSKPNHIAAPLQLPDETWWTIGQSYEKYSNDNWSGMGQQNSLFPVSWEVDRPWGMAPTTQPILRPKLSQAGILRRSFHSDYFDKDSLGLCWHFLGKKDWARYSLTARKGWIRLAPETARTNIVQKETDHYYSAVTKVELNAAVTSQKAGLYLSNGNQKIVAQLYAGFDNDKKILFKLDRPVRNIPNHFSNTVWLKIERKEHLLTGYCSSDWKKWVPLGAAISAAPLYKTQPSWNSWVGISAGLFAEGKPADFDFFICKDGFSSLTAAGYSNCFGVEKVDKCSDAAVTNTSINGGWLMISGIDLGQNKKGAAQIKGLASSDKNGNPEIWLDDLKNGKLVATIPVRKANDWKIFSKALKDISGHHEVFAKFPAGSHHEIFIESIQFVNAT